MSMFMGQSYGWWSSQFKANYELGLVYSMSGRYKDNRPIGSIHNISGYVHLFKRDDKGVGMTVKIHRLIYFLYHGNIDENLMIDHIDRVKTNNVISNLRQVTAQENSKNLGEVNTSGEYIGVYDTNGSVGFRLTFDKKEYTKGGFSTKHDAYLARSYLKSVLSGGYLNF